MSGDRLDLDAIEARATRAGQSWVHDPYGHLTTLVGYDVPALVAEVRSLRDESAALVDEIERCDRAEMALRAVAAETEVRRLRAAVETARGFHSSEMLRHCQERHCGCGGEAFPVARS